jgi:hypothetical protein
MNVFLAPSELYTEVAATPVQTSSWLIPYVVLLLLAFVSTYAVWTNPTLRQQIYSMQEKGMAKAVEQGKMTQEQMDRASEQIENSGVVLFMAFGAGFQLLAISAMLFLGSLLFWVGAKVVMKFTGAYNKILEVVGLASLIGILGAVVTVMLMYLMGSITATPGGGILLGESFDPLNKAHKLIAALNIFTLWEIGLVGFGLAKVSGKSAGPGLAVAFGLWALWTICIAMIG